MNREDYYAESIGHILRDMGKYDLFTADEIAELGDAIASSAECESQAFYRPENQRVSEREQCEKKIRELKADMERAIDIREKWICGRLGLSRHQVNIDDRDGRVYISETFRCPASA